MAQRQAHKMTNTKSKLAEETTMDIIREINRLLIKAHTENLVTVASVLEDARESIAWWAVNDNHTDTEAEILAHELKYSSALQIAAAFLNQLQKTRAIEPEMIKLMEECVPTRKKISARGKSERSDYSHN